MRNPARWYGVANGAVSSATPTSAPNTVPTANGTPNGSFVLNSTNVNLNTGAVSSNLAYNFLNTGPANYNFNPISTGTPTISANNHPNLALQGYVAGMMVTASGGSAPPFKNYTPPYIVTNVSGTPGDVSIYLPGNSSQMGAVFNVASVNAPSGGLSTASYLFGSYSPSDPSNTQGRNTARGTYVDPSDFAGRAASVFDNGANAPLSSRNGVALSAIGGYANQQMVTAQSVGANTASFLSSISSAAVQPCACNSTQWGFWSAINGANNSSGQLLSRIRAICSSGSRAFPQLLQAFPRPARPRTPAMWSLTSRRPAGSAAISPRAVSQTRSTLEPGAAPSRSAASTERTTPARSHGSRRQPCSGAR